MANLSFYYPLSWVFLILFIPSFLLILRHFIRTRYIPSLILIGIYSILIAILGGFLDTKRFPPESQTMVETYFLIGLILVLAAGVLIVYFFESVNGNTLSNLSGMITTGCAYIYGTMTNPIWTILYTEDKLWTFSLEFKFAAYLGIYWALICTCIFYRLASTNQSKQIRIITSNVAEKKQLLSTMPNEPAKPLIYHRYAKIIIILFLSVPISGYLGYVFNISYIGMVCCFIAFLIFSILYIIDPKIFFLHRSTISNIIFLDVESGIPLFILNDPEEKDLIAATFNGSILAQREISGTTGLPEEYIYGDMACLMSVRHIADRTIIAILVTSKKISNYRSSLNYLLRKFDETYYGHIKRAFNSTEPYEEFAKQCYKVFDYAIFQPQTEDFKKLVP